MSLQSRLSALITAIGNEFKSYDARVSALEGGSADGILATSPSVLTTTNGVFQDKINVTDTIAGGNYKLTISYGYNYNSQTSDFVSRVLIDGVVAHTGDELHRQEPKDSAGTGSGDLSGTGTNQAFSFTRVLVPISLTAGSHNIQLQVASGGGSAASIWDAVILLERIAV